MRGLRRRKRCHESCLTFQLKHDREPADRERLPTILFAGGHPCRRLRLVRHQVKPNSIRDRESELRSVRLAHLVLELWRQPAFAKVNEKTIKGKGEKPC